MKNRKYYKYWMPRTKGLSYKGWCLSGYKCPIELKFILILHNKYGGLFNSMLGMEYKTSTLNPNGRSYSLLEKAYPVPKAYLEKLKKIDKVMCIGLMEKKTNGI